MGSCNKNDTEANNYLWRRLIQAPHASTISTPKNIFGTYSRKWSIVYINTLSSVYNVTKRKLKVTLCWLVRSLCFIMVLTEDDCGFSTYFGINFNIHSTYKIQFDYGFWYCKFRLWVVSVAYGNTTGY